MNDNDVIIDKLIDFIFKFDIDERICRKEPQPCKADEFCMYTETDKIREACKQCIIKHATDNTQ